MHRKEDVQLLNMVMLERADGAVLVLDKVKKKVGRDSLFRVER